MNERLDRLCTDFVLDRLCTDFVLGTDLACAPPLWLFISSPSAHTLLTVQDEYW